MSDEAGRRDPRETPGAKPKAWVRLLALGAVLITAWHLFASFLWIAPYSENAREIVPGDALRNYMLPMFGQSWSVFAPEPINGDYSFEVRASLPDGTDTDWVSATDVELSMIRRTLVPPRAGIQSTELASRYKSAYDALDGSQKSIIGGNLQTEEWRADLREALERAGDAADAADSEAGVSGTGDADPAASGSEEIEAILAQERSAAAYATQVAHAIWGDEVRAVQFRVSRQNIVPFAQRHDPDAERPDAVIVASGWRGTVVEPGQNEENFARVFRAQYERIAR